MYKFTDIVTPEELSSKTVTSYYEKGYLFTRKGKGVMIQTRSLRINLDSFKLSSENRRILKKNSSLTANVINLPMQNYVWQIHKLAKDFYTTKFGKNIMSASKVKEMFTNQEKSNMNLAFEFKTSFDTESLGFALCYKNASILHYAYPFYKVKLLSDNPSVGLGMMIKAILWAKENDKKFVYIGSVVEQSALYKLQFSGLEWWDNNYWNKDIKLLKEMIKKSN